MGKTSGKSLAGKYHDFLEPRVQIQTPLGEIPSGDGVYLEKVEVTASVGMDPDMAIVVYRADKGSEQGLAGIEKYFDAGQKMEVKAGYGKELSRIFLGYLHQVEAEDSMWDYVEYTLICLDVKGLMKKNSVFQISGRKKRQQVINDILDTECYRELIESREIASLPQEWNQDCVVRGETHYDWLCSLASGMDYEFFCGTGKAVFRQAGKAGSDILELSVEYGLQKARRVVTLAGLTGSVQVWGYNRKDERLTGTADWQGASGIFTNRLKRALKGCTRIFLDREAETGEEAEKRAKARLGRLTGSCVRMEAVTLGLPELLPGICAEIVEEGTPGLAGMLYVEEARHLLDEKGYRTTIAGRPCR